MHVSAALSACDMQSRMFFKGFNSSSSPKTLEPVNPYLLLQLPVFAGRGVQGLRAHSRSVHGGPTPMVCTFASSLTRLSLLEPRPPLSLLKPRPLQLFEPPPCFSSGGRPANDDLQHLCSLQHSIARLS
jgi:hypothetical protein